MLRVRNSGASEHVHLNMTHSYYIENFEDHLNDPHAGPCLVTLYIADTEHLDLNDLI